MPIAKKNLAVFKSSAGFGLKTLVDIKKDDEVVEYKGKRISDEQADEKPNRYLFEIDDKWTIDGSDRSNIARYINHSCRPNCEAIHYEVEDGKDSRTDEIMIVAKRNITAGEELTYDYGKSHFNEYIKPHGCKCSKCQEKKSKKKA